MKTRATGHMYVLAPTNAMEARAHVCLTPVTFISGFRRSLALFP